MADPADIPANDGKSADSVKASKAQTPNKGEGHCEHCEAHARAIEQINAHLGLPQDDVTLDEHTQKRKALSERLSHRKRH